MIEDLDPVIHMPKRLAAMAMLANAPSVSFRFLKEQLGLGDSDRLSRCRCWRRPAT